MTLHDSGNSPIRKVSSGTGVSPVFSRHYLRPRLSSTGETPVPLASWNRASPFRWLEIRLPVSPATQHRSREPGGRPGSQEREAHDPLQRGSEFGKIRIEGN